MLPEGWVDILANVGLCAVVVALWTELSHRAFRRRPRARAGLLGVVMGGGAVLAMLVPYQVAAGVFFDLRTVLVTLAGFFGGPVAGIVAAVPAGLYRAYAGGAGALPGCVGIAAAAALGCLGHRICRDRGIGFRELAALGVCVALTNLATPLLLPRAVWTVLLPDFGPVLFTAVSGTIMLLGATLLTMRHREELAATNALYRAMVQSLPDSLNVKDLDGRFVIANAATARLMGAEAPEQLIGRTDFDFYPREIAQRYRADELAFLAEGRPVLIDQPIGAASSAEGWLSTLKTLFYDDEGRPAGIITHNRDITERKRGEIALSEARDAADVASRAKSQFLAVMSHEIRTPLTAVIGIADLLAKRQLDPRSTSYVEGIRRAGKQLLAIVNDTLDFFRLGAGQLALRETDFDLEAVLEELRSTFYPMARERGLRLEVPPLGDASASLRGDPVRLRQVLFNLVGNALRFTDEGEIRVSASLDDRADGRCRLRVAVRDTGLGIPEDELIQLFQPFSQVESGASRSFGGAGLGLAICRQLVEAMGGRIGCESRVGQGSTFSFEVALERGRAITKPPEPAGAAPARPLAVLLAEDAPLNRQLITEMLASRGHAVTGGEDGAACLRQAEAGDFDVLLIDIQMPLMDGQEVIRRLRQGGGRNSRTPAIALTANVMVEDRGRYLAAGFDAVLHKPIAWAELFSAMQRLATTPRGATAGDGPSAPLIDRTVFAEVAAVLEAGAADELVRQALAEARDGLRRLRDEDLGAQGRFRLGHRLKGTARSLGLAGIGDAAEAVESAARSGGELAPALERYAHALEATEELVARGQGAGSLAARPAERQKAQQAT